MTDPERIAEWAPIAFEVDGLATRSLRAGTEARVSGMIAGVRATLEVEVSRADERGLHLAARGPVAMEVEYRFRAHGGGVMVEARITLGRREGISAQVMRSATRALLNAGALGRALYRLEGALPEPFEGRLAA